MTRKDNLKVRDFWKKFNMMDSVANIAVSWDELRCLAQTVSVRYKFSSGRKSA